MSTSIGVLMSLILPIAAVSPLWLAPLTVIFGGPILLFLFYKRTFIDYRQNNLKFGVSILALLWLWAITSLLWTINVQGALLEIVRTGCLFAFLPIVIWGSQVPQNLREGIINAFLIGFLVGLGLIVIQIFLGATFINLWQHSFLAMPRGVFALNRTAAVLAIFVWPALIILWERSKHRLCLAIALIAIALLWVLSNETALLSYAIGLLVAAIAVVVPKMIKPLLGVILAGGVLVAPFLPQTILMPDKWLSISCIQANPSFLHRLYIWQFASQKIEERPLLGWGFNSARALPEGHEIIHINPPCTENITSGEKLPLHTHNAVLQIWLELGAVGAIILAAFLAWASYRIQQIDRMGSAIGYGHFITTLMIASMSFGAWQSWWLCTILLSVLLMTFARARP
ncbi:MAG: O-antigen ligase family protein [Alphaproteobacteria bacterium]